VRPLELLQLVLKALLLLIMLGRDLLDLSIQLPLPLLGVVVQALLLGHELRNSLLQFSLGLLEFVFHLLFFLVRLYLLFLRFVGQCLVLTIALFQ
jgi:hypothetical protein